MPVQPVDWAGLHWWFEHRGGGDAFRAFSMWCLRNPARVTRPESRPPPFNAGQHRPRQRRPRAPTVERFGAEWVRLYVNDGLTMEDIAKRHNLTRERIRQVLTTMGVSGRAVDEQRRQKRHQERELGELLAAMQRATELPPCRVCGAWVIRGGNGTITCSPDCAKAWTALRYHLDDAARQKHRRIVAQRVVDNPSLAKNKQQLEYSRAVLSDNPPPPNRRWVGPNSRARRALEAAGIEVAVTNGRALTFPCAATNRDGSPCSRHVQAEGARCHIHLGLARKVAS